MLQFQPQEHLLHSYIVASQSEQARDRLSLDLAAAMLCRSDGVRPCRTCRDCRKVYDGVHPDVIYVAPDPDAKVPTIKSTRSAASRPRRTFCRARRKRRSMFCVRRTR